jgi:hypothetical protein
MGSSVTPGNPPGKPDSVRDDLMRGRRLRWIRWLAVTLVSRGAARASGRSRPVACSGMDGYVSKPVRRDELLDAIGQALRAPSAAPRRGASSSLPNCLTPQSLNSTRSHSARNFDGKRLLHRSLRGGDQ